jgi:predicted TIM-barrel fold metal-dependent hydrolase
MQGVEFRSKPNVTGGDSRCAHRSRRSFLRAALAGVGTLTTATWRRTTAAEPATQATAPLDLKLGPLVDIHTHLGQTWNRTEVLTAADLLRWMDAHHVAQAIVLPLVNPEASSFPLTTDFVLEQTRPHRDRLIPFCAIDPRASYSDGQPGMTAMLRRYQEAGARGFGEHKPGLPIDDPRSEVIYRACGELQLPVLFHLDNERNLDKPGLPGLERMLTACPDTIFIGHGPGWWASISGGVSAADLARYPRGKVQPGGAIDTLMDRHANLYGDLSAGSGAGAIERDREFGREFLVRRADRLLFGTDYLSPGQAVPQFELLAGIELPPEVRAKIYRDNARRLLGLA